MYRHDPIQRKRLHLCLMSISMNATQMRLIHNQNQGLRRPQGMMCVGYHPMFDANGCSIALDEDPTQIVSAQFASRLVALHVHLTQMMLLEMMQIVNPLLMEHYARQIHHLK